jgi:hypothetical protein
MPFEVFNRQRAPISSEPTITIQKRGNISLNTAAYVELGQPEALELLYDRDERLIAMRKVDPGGASAYTVRPLDPRARKNPRTATQLATTYLVSGIAFTTYYGISTDVAKRWTPYRQDDMLVVDLKQPGMEVTSNRSSDSVPPDSERRLFSDERSTDPRHEGEPTARVSSTDGSPNGS